MWGATTAEAAGASTAAAVARGTITLEDGEEAAEEVPRVAPCFGGCLRLLFPEMGEGKRVAEGDTLVARGVEEEEKEQEEEEAPDKAEKEEEEDGPEGDGEEKGSTAAVAAAT